MNKIKLAVIVFFVCHAFGFAEELKYNIVDTGVSSFYSNSKIISEPNSGEAFWGQDAQFQNNSPSYTDNRDGTITDDVTGLVWMKDMGEKMSYDDAIKYARKLTIGSFSDWRVPTIKELYSLIIFTGSVKGE